MTEKLETLSLVQLRDLAKEKGLKNISKFRKSELIELLEEQQIKEEKKNKPKTIDKTIDDTLVETPRKTKKENVKDKNVEAIEEKKEEKKERINTRTDSFIKSKDGTVLRENIKSKEVIEEREKPRTEVRERIDLKDRNENKNDEDRVFPSDVMEASGVLEIQEANNFGFLRGENYLTSPEDVYVSPTQIRRFHLKTGDLVTGKTRPTREGEKFKALIFVDKVNGDSPDKAIRRRDFDTLTPIYPEERLYLEVEGKNDLTTRMMDIICPIGKGQRGLIVAPPKAGKTTILKKIAQNIRSNYKDIKLIVLLIDERPEEVTDMKESIDGDVIFSTFDEDPMNHIKVSSMVLDRARRLVEHGKDVVILLDSITRLSRAHNLTCTPSGRTLTGGLDPAALLMPKKFFGAARNIRGGGSLTILATALVDTGSKMDDMIFEEFKGTGNMEVHLDRKLQERRIFPAIDIYKSGTRKEELLYTPDEMEASRKIRSSLNRGADVGKITEDLISLLANTKDNKELTDLILKRNLG